MELMVPRMADFALTGKGLAEAWLGAEWQVLARVGDGKADYPTRAKVVYSDNGIYFLVECADQRLTYTMTQDNDDIYREDVVEVFLWPFEEQHVYFEYEISPLDVELSILVANHQGRVHGWLPWHYEGARRVRHATTVQGGPQASMAEVKGWTTEFFFPFSLFAGLGNVPPTSGTRWRGNIYRIDYDAAPTSQWAWCPDTGGNFHDFLNFGTLVFE